MSNNIQDTNGGIVVVVVVEECFSEEEEQFYSTYDDDDDDDDDEIEQRLSDCSVILDVVTSSILPYNDEVVILVNNNNRDCRICHMSLDEKDDEKDDDAIELGCCCKNDLAAAHKHCALTWFKIKGNKICEICNSIATNLVVPNEMSLVDGSNDANPVATSVAVTHMSTSGRGGRRGGGEGGCINGHRLLNFILACLVFAFVISWLFHFNIPS